MFRRFPQLLGAFLLMLCASVRTSTDAAEEAPRSPWVGFHCMAPKRADLPKMKRLVDELARLGVNVLVLQVDYRFQFASYPQVGAPEWFNKEDARDLLAHCRSRGIRLIPQLSCVGHQSPGGSAPAYGLLREFPQFDEAPHLSETSEGFYCREWCPSNPDVYPVVYALIDEIIDAFDADAFHVGMDEVFLIGDPKCPRCAGKPKAELFAGAVNRLHNHLVTERGLTMLMWADRLIDGRLTLYGSWEGSFNGTQGALAMIPKDIILCDWHYEVRPVYPSVPHFISKGFRVWPSVWRNREATLAFLMDARKHAAEADHPERNLGALFTTWVYPEIFDILHGEGNPNHAHPYYLGALESLQEGTRFLGVPSVPFPPVVDTPNLGFVEPPFVLPLHPHEGDTATIRYTLDGSDVTAESPLYTEPLRLTVPGILLARAFNDRGASLLLRADIQKLDYLPPSNPVNPVNGLDCRIYKGPYERTTDFLTAAPAETRIVKDIDLSPAPSKNAFALVFTGFIKVDSDGVYTFRVGADDGASLLFHEQLVVDNDGKHTARWREAPVALRAGCHAFSLPYFDAAGDKTLELQWITPAGTREKVPASALFRAAPGETVHE